MICRIYSFIKRGCPGKSSLFLLLPAPAEVFMVIHPLLHG
jgi:hypothetical protein